MTILDGFRALARTWFVVLCGVALSVAGAVIAGRTEAVYWTQTTVRFLGPDTSRPGIDGNSFVSSTESMIALAGLTLEELRLPDAPAVADRGTSIVDVGIYDGTWIRLPNAGNQWATNFGEAALDVQVSGSDAEQVRARTISAVASIDKALAKRQNAAHARPDDLVVTQSIPGRPTILRSQASRTKPMATALALGLAFTIALSIHIDYRRSRIRVRRSGSQLPGRHRATEGRIA